MPKKNDTLDQSKKGKNDECYTQYEDIQREINAYLEYNPDTFRDKIVLLPCDDPEWSNFTKFFAQNFKMLGLKKLISTSYATESKNQYAQGYQFTLEDLFTDKDNATYEVLDGQQRITFFGRFKTDKFAIMGDDGVPHYYTGLAKDLKKKIDDARLTIYVCEGTENEIKAWFRTINISGKPLNDQEIANATHSGPFVTKAREEFSNSQNANVQKWSAYISGDVKRQAYLKTALEWVSKGHIDEYMSQHRYDTNINELKAYFTSVIDWVSSVFSDVESEMCGLPWGELYEKYHTNSYNPQEVHTKLQELYSDFYVKNRKGCYEYILGGCTDTKLIDIRIFDEVTKKTVYKRQTADAEASGMSNCPMCAASGQVALMKRFWKYAEMDADHVQAWSNGGATDIANCQMLCKTHNRSKGNR